MKQQLQRRSSLAPLISEHKSAGNKYLVRIFILCILGDQEYPFVTLVAKAISRKSEHPNKASTMQLSRQSTENDR